MKEVQNVATTPSQLVNITTVTRTDPSAENEGMDVDEHAPKQESSSVFPSPHLTNASAAHLTQDKEEGATEETPAEEKVSSSQKYQASLIDEEAPSCQVETCHAELVKDGEKDAGKGETESLEGKMENLNSSCETDDKNKTVSSETHS